MPQGVVTFLMTDVEGSTRHWEQHPEAIREALIRHTRIATEVVSQNGGWLIKNRGAGDSLFIVFADTVSALQAAVDIQRTLEKQKWKDDIEFHVRMALHCGQVDLIEGTYYGVTVNYAGRLSSLGHGGQILASEAFVQELEAIPAPIALRNLGFYTLLSGQEVGKVYQVTHPELEPFFYRLRFVNPVPHNLPQNASHYFGQAELVQQILYAIPLHPLITLISSDGFGKTRIALEVSKVVQLCEGEGVWYVDLNENRSGEQILAEVLEVAPTELYATLREKRVLIICDGCKKNPQMALEFAEGLLQNCPEIRLLMCCLVPFGHPRETVISIPPLPTPSEEIESDLALFTVNDSVALFVDRVCTHTPSFQVDTTNVIQVGRICRYLEGIPYALELAAMRCRDSSLQAVCEELEAASSVGEACSTLARVIAWSYEKLEETPQILLQRLSVLSGVWTLETAETVGSDERIELWEVLDFLNELLDRNLVLYEEEEGTPHYRLHHTVRQFALKLLQERGEESVIRERYAAYLQEKGGTE